MKLAVAMSGGVDSSAAAAILKEQGHELVGFTMQLWNQRRGINVNENGNCGFLRVVVHWTMCMTHAASPKSWAFRFLRSQPGKGFRTRRGAAVCRQFLSQRRDTDFLCVMQQPA